MSFLSLINFQNQKRGKILKITLKLLNLIKRDLNNNDYLMIKASNATGFK